MKLLIAIIIFCVSFGANAQEQSCTSTFSNSTGLETAVASAANGSVICLNSGSYGSVSFSGITGRTGFVTVRSTSGRGATISPQVVNSRYIRFRNLTINDMLIQACSQNIQVVNNTWVQDTSGISVYNYGFGCSGATDSKIVIDGNNFTNTRPSWSEGKIGIVEVNGVILRNNLIQGQSTNNGGDGIQTGGSLNNVIIGPGNHFKNIRQAPCESTPGAPHCDAIQFVSDCPNCQIIGNWFDDVEVVLQHHDATTPVIFKNNLITNAVQMWCYSTPGSCSNAVIDHNTFYNVSNFISWGMTGGGVSDTTGLVARNNILIGTTVGPATCNTPSCTFTNNLCQTSGQCSFNTTNTTIATPTFVGGAPASITTWGGWKLAPGSAGKGTATDGLDRGTTYFSPGPVGGFN